MAFNAPSKALLYNEFAKLLKAGFGIDKAADTVLSGKPPPEHREFSEVLNRGLGEGKSIAGAVADVALPVSEVEKRLIAAGEKGGRLEAAFAHLAGYFQSVDQTARQVRSGLVYPLVLVHLAVILPTFPRMFSQNGNLGGVFGAIFLKLAVVYGIGILVFFAWKTVSRMAQENAGLDRFLNRVPLLGKVRRSTAFARFCRVFEIYLLAGHKMDESVQAASAVSMRGDIRAACRDIETGAKAGDLIGPQILENPAFPPPLARSLASAEEAGSLEKDLHSWAEIMDADTAESLEKLGAWATKIIYFAALLLMAWQIVSLALDVYFKPLQQMLDSI